MCAVQVNDFGDVVGLICRSELTHDNLQRVRERLEGPKKPKWRDRFRYQHRSESVISANTGGQPYGSTQTTEVVEVFPGSRAYTAVDVPSRVGDFAGSGPDAVPAVVRAGSLGADTDLSWLSGSSTRRLK